MTQAAGHSFDSLGFCSCGRTKRDLRAVVYEYRAIGKTAIGETGFAHTGICNQPEWISACEMVDAEDAAYDAALAQVCRA